MRCPGRVYRCNALQIPRTTVRLSSTFTCFSFRHFRFKMSFSATSGNLNSCFSALFAFDSTLLCDWWKGPNVEYYVVASVRLALLHSMSLLDTLLMF